LDTSLIDIILSGVGVNMAVSRISLQRCIREVVTFLNEGNFKEEDKIY
jgi:hypothetical protein